MCASSYFFIGPKSKSAAISQMRNASVSSAYRFNGMVLRNSEKPSSVLDSGRDEPTAAAHEEIGAMMQTGAAVASMMYASFAREMLYLSVTGRMTVPTVRQLK